MHIYEVRQEDDWTGEKTSIAYFRDYDEAKKYANDLAERTGNYYVVGSLYVY